MKVLITTTSWEKSTFIVDQVNALKRSGLIIEVFQFYGKRSIINYIKDRLRLKKIINREKFDLVHAHFGQCGIVSKFIGVPLITTFHGSDATGLINKKGKYSFSGKILKLISYLSYFLSDKSIFVSKSVKNNLNVNKNSLILPCGVNTINFKPLPMDYCKNKLDLGNFIYILFAGDTSSLVKNYKLALKSIEILKGMTKTPFKMIPLKGYQHYNVPTLMNGVNVLLMTSHHEGSPMVIKEAMACNTPIVSVDVGDVKEMIGDISGCYVIEDKKEESIAIALKKCIEGPSKINSRKFTKDIDLEVINNRLQGIYNDVIN